MPCAMINNAVQRRVMFRHPFILPGMAEPQPPGTYRIITDQEELRSASFTALKTISAFLEVPVAGLPCTSTRRVPICLDALDACVLADRSIDGPLPQQTPA